MSKLEDFQPGAAVRGILPDSLVMVVSVQWFGSEALELTYKDPAGRVANRLLYRHDEPGLDLVEHGRPWSFDGEVKGRVTDAKTITVTKNEILYSLNKPEDFILAIVEFIDDTTHRVHYLRRLFRREPDFDVTSVNYEFAKLLERAEAPS